MKDVISTIEVDYKYRMKKIIESLKENFDELKDLNGDDLYEAIYEDGGINQAFAEAVLNDLYDFNGCEFE